MANLMRKLGYWKFDIAGITSEKLNASDCVNGTLLKLSFRSGGQFSWGGVLWQGNESKSASELDLLLGMKNGEAAGQEKIQAGLTNVSAAYLKDGFIEYRLSSANSLVDERNLCVNYQVQITEGKQYRMDKFLSSYYLGFSLPINKLIKQWRVKTGEPFDEIYFEGFKENIFKPWRQAYSPNTELSLVRMLDKTKMTVNVAVALPPAVRMQPSRN